MIWYDMIWYDSAQQVKANFIILYYELNQLFPNQFNVHYNQITEDKD